MQAPLPTLILTIIHLYIHTYTHTHTHTPFNIVRSKKRRAPQKLKQQMADDESLPDSHIINFDLDDWNPDAAAVKSDSDQYLTTIPSRGFSVEFQIVHEIHGKYERNIQIEDNASLLVIRIIPRPKVSSNRILWFEVKLAVRTYLEPDDYDAAMGNDPEIIAYEPAPKGSVNYDDYTVKVTDEATSKTTLSIAPPVGGVTGSEEFSKSRSKEYSVRTLHELKSGRDKSDLSMSRPNRAWWDVTAANQQDGIGDSLTVALLIKRPASSKFQLTADTKAKMSGTHVPWGKKKSDQVLGIFPLPPDPRTNKCPQGVSTDDLHAASEEEIMRTLNVGMHVSERETPVAYLPQGKVQL
jgi:hypothetical protein